VGRDYYGGVSIRTTPDDASNIDGRNVVSENTGRGAGDMEEEDAILIVAAVNACDRLAPGLPPDNLEEYVRALVRAARAWHECSMVSDTWFDMKTHGLDEALARSEALIAALAPFKGLEEP
jgi:hypothetical protein